MTRRTASGLAAADLRGTRSDHDIGVTTHKMFETNDITENSTNLSDIGPHEPA